MSTWQTQSSLEPNFGQKTDGLKIGSCVKMKEQYLIIFCFFLSFVLRFFALYSNTRMRGLSRGIKENESNFLGAFPKVDFVFPIPKSWLCYPLENIQSPVMGISYTLSVSLGEYLIPHNGIFFICYPKCFCLLPQASFWATRVRNLQLAFVLCLGQTPVTPTLPLSRMSQPPRQY
jgi:hypothetical protein